MVLAKVQDFATIRDAKKCLYLLIIYAIIL